ncbi:MAG: thiamine-phosphate kinase [Rudaea sp.]|uniref:thiamine-phosphate kinase n=1 Tax=unclassified Rudaea TaxID=2627037 RepID=UPI0010F9AFC1|nr:MULTISPECIES: thiamine-phosphate kinase [unclassified Rudaea]MBN8885854.1 thiamine-phosphate kinase [Rudaea sp.]
MAEFALIDLIRARCEIAREDVRLGIGDDAALLAVPAGQALAVSTDTLVSGVHFPKDTPPRDIGWKALAVNLSDLAAMGATPAWATLALTLPQADREWVSAFADGFAALAGEFKLALVGGDTTQGPLAITVTVHGFVPEHLALRRDGAQAGDAVLVTGTLGDAAAGLRLLHDAAHDGRQRTALVDRLDRPTPRVAQGLLLRGRAHACIDVSDGLLADLGHICAASGVGAEIEAELLPASPALLGLFDDEARIALQLGGGDDYELCFTASEALASELLSDLARSGCGATRIGRIVADPGIRVRNGAGGEVRIGRAGWEHFGA